jgi:O-antigen ligase
MKTRFANAILLASLVAAVFSNNTIPYLPMLGGAAWIYVFYYSEDIYKNILPVDKALLTLLLVGCGLAVIGTHSKIALLGTNYSDVGVFVLLGCVGIGLVASTLPLKSVIKGVYGAALVLAVTAPLYDYWKYGSFSGRLQGIIGQSNVMAAWLGVGFLLGLYLLAQKRSTKQKVLLAVSQAALLAALFQTETRAALLLTLLLTGVYVIANQKYWRTIVTGVLPGLALIIILFFVVKVPRLSDARYATSSVTYRIELQTMAVKSLRHTPAWGIGPGNEPHTLSCNAMQSYGQLNKTCQQGYTFTSSHNIFLDRFIQLGWLSGLAYLAIFITGAVIGLRSKQCTKQILGFSLLLIGLYYLTNVTKIELELLVWVLLGGALTIRDVSTKKLSFKQT